MRTRSQPQTKRVQGANSNRPAEAVGDARVHEDGGVGSVNLSLPISFE